MKSLIIPSTTKEMHMSEEKRPKEVPSSPEQGQPKEVPSQEPKEKPAEGKTAESKPEGKPAGEPEKRESAAKPEKTKKVRPTNCAACNKAFKHKIWYYKIYLLHR